jgi:hypothetical protein
LSISLLARGNFCFAFGYMAACTNTKKIPRRLVAITLSNVYAVNVMEQAFWTDLKILVGRHKQAKLAGKIERSGVACRCCWTR